MARWVERPGLARLIASHANYDLPTPLCLGSTECQPVAFVHGESALSRAFFGDANKGILTYIRIASTTSPLRPGTAAP
jgi:hypothetical protein